MNDDEVMNLLHPAMKAAKDSGFELFAVLADPKKEGTYTCYQPFDPERPIFHISLLQEIASIYSELAYSRR